MTVAGGLRLGVDVGGTHTDAVVLDARDRLLVKTKARTSADVREGLAQAVEGALATLGQARAGLHRAMLGTTHATNAVMQRKSLRRVGVLRLGAPLTGGVPPLATWPEELRRAVLVDSYVARGGVEYDGREMIPLDVDAIARFVASVAGRAEAVAITGVFATAAPEQELLAAEIVQRELGATPVSLSHEIGSMGLIERENATVLNAALAGTVHDVVEAFATVLGAHRLQVDPFFAQNDGTLMALEYAERFPALTFGSGPVNSMRGAAHLSGVRDAVVVDIGGSTTEVGVLVNGFPREMTHGANIAGVETNFRMPDIASLELGGGSVVRAGARGPLLSHGSVGYELPRQALVFGGDTPTLTDAGVAAERVALGNHAVPTRHRRSLAAALRRSDLLLVEALDRLQVGAAPGVVLAVGGGSFLLPPELGDGRRVVRPQDFEVANAIGAAIAPVGGSAEQICPNNAGALRAALQSTRRDAFQRAVEAGADPDALEVVEVQQLPLPYLVDPAVRIRVKVAGPLQDTRRAEHETWAPGTEMASEPA